MALPFFQNSIAGDLLFTAGLFTIYHLAAREKSAAITPA
jgi:hypothetical protein